MSDYVVTARKWRPMVFEDVVGQGHVTQTLRNAIATGRLAHAYLFSGPRGVGKTTTARLLAKAVNCRHPREANPDNECDICREITDGTSFDVLEIDGASNRGIDEIRNLRESVRYTPAKGRFKIYIIDEVHMLTRESFNALLKTLEEPPSHVMFIFATTEIHKVPQTILSRCQRFDFRRIAIQEIIANLAGIAGEEKIAIDEESLMLIARKGDGSLRDAQSMFDQVVSLIGRAITHRQILDALNIVDQEVYFRVTDYIDTGNARGGLELVDEIFRQGHDVKDFLAGLQEHFRNLLVSRTTGSTELIEASDVYRKRYAQEAGRFTPADLLRFQRLIAGTESAIRWSAQPRFRVEADMVQLIGLPRAQEIGTLLDSVEALKKNFLGKAAGEESAAGSASPVQSAGRTVMPNLPHAAAGSAGKVLSDAEVRSRWGEYLAEVRRQRISLGSVLESTRLYAIRGNIICLGCSNDFERSAILRNREFLSNLVGRVFNVPGRIEAELVPGEETAGSDGDASTGGQSGPESEEHPIIAAMKRELGAEPLE